MQIEQTRTPETIASLAWWRNVRDNQERFCGWLLDQYRGEASAAIRIEQLRDSFAEVSSKAYRLLSVIASQERQHASWVLSLLEARGLHPEKNPPKERYWEKTLPGISDLETGCAVGAHAERMRLARIEAIANDPAAPSDVREVFQKILPQERFHERAFRSLATPEALSATQDAHDLGLKALGLVP